MSWRMRVTVKLFCWFEVCKHFCRQPSRGPAVSEASLMAKVLLYQNYTVFAACLKAWNFYDQVHAGGSPSLSAAVADGR
jgi:hypothetical protein